jgi:ParB family chromosome partitioning protein
MMAATQDMPKTSNVTATVARPASKPRTAPGMMLDLASAHKRIEDLEAAARTHNGSLPVAAIVPNPWQPRLKFDEAELQALAENIRARTLIQPILVRRVPSRDGAPAAPEQYQIAVGERRWRAHKLLGWAEIRAFVVDLSDEEMAFSALSENVQREELTDYEISKSLQILAEQFGEQTKSDLAGQVGVSRSQYYRLLSFQKLPDFLRADLDAEPGLLGAQAAENLAAVILRHEDKGEAVGQALGDLWRDFKKDPSNQLRLGALLDVRLTQKPQVSARRDIGSLYLNGAKAGDMRRDGKHFIVRLRTGVVTEDQQKKVQEFMESLFSTAK